LAKLGDQVVKIVTSRNFWFNFVAFQYFFTCSLAIELGCRRFGSHNSVQFFMKATEKQMSLSASRFSPRRARH
jgi:hypothetical protein